MEYGLIGERLGHSYSKEIHEKIAPYRYELLELSPEEVAPFLKKRAFRAINVTIPYKEVVMPYLDVISPEAKEIGAVNTVVNRDGKLFGYNTDFGGMCALFDRGGMDLRGKKVVILGTGGTAKTAKAVATARGAAQTLCVSRTERKGDITYEELLRHHTDAHFILNTTPVGMHPHTENCPIDVSCFPGLCGVADAIYHPLRTNLIQDAMARGIPAVGGLYMLVAQAVFAAAHFCGTRLGTGDIQRIYREVEAQKRNIVLIGMPSSGKTTIGQLLEEKLGKPFVDTDQLIEERIGMPIAQWFARFGEPEFRRVEREVIAELAKKDGLIIATGGGAVLDCRNTRALRQNGVNVFLDRAPERLIPTADRPLARDRAAIYALYEQRAPIYAAAADRRVDGNGSAEETANAVCKELTL